MAKTKAEKITSIEEEIRQLENRRKRHRSAGTGQNAYAAAWQSTIVVSKSYPAARASPLLSPPLTGREKKSQMSLTE